MNLVQIQEHLKGMPIQALMAYANGMNTDVPPYLALGELNRRKQMQQSMEKPEAPQGTVKDKIESETGLMAIKKQAIDQMQLNALRQQQMAQSQTAQSAMRPQPVPAGVPEPEMQEAVMADGGIATIMVPNNVTEFGSGGIVAFANGELVEDVYGENVLGAKEYISKKVREREEKAREEERERDEFLERAGAARISPAEQRAPVQVAPALDYSNEGRPRPVAPPVVPVRGPGITNTRVAQPPAPAAPVAPAAPAAAPAPVAGMDYLAMLANQASGKDAQGKPLSTYAQQRAVAEKTDPYLTKQPGAVIEDYLKRMQEKQAADEARQQELEKDRTRAGLWRSLIAAGEASRGQRGIGALMAGFGRTAGEELEAGRGREEAQMKARREYDQNVAKMQQEIENARIARSEGRFKDAAAFDQRAKESREQAISKGAEIQAIAGRDTTKFAQEKDLAKIRFEYERRLKAIPQAERPSLEREYVEELVKAGKSRSDAIREAKTLGTGAERQDLAELKALQKTYQDQADPTKNFDKASREDAVRRLAAVNSRIEQMAGMGGGAGPKEGDKATSNSGKPIIYRNGRWEYQ